MHFMYGLSDELIPEQEEPALTPFESLTAMLAGAMFFADEYKGGYIHTDMIRKFIKIAEEEEG